MGEAVSILRLIELAGSLSVTLLLVVAIWALFSGRVPTPREYQTTLERISQAEDRADKAEKEAHDAHHRLRILTESLPKITELIDSMDRRLDMHGFPQRERPRWRWPWEDS